MLDWIIDDVDAAPGDNSVHRLRESVESLGGSWTTYDPHNWIRGHDEYIIKTSIKTALSVDDNWVYNVPKFKDFRCSKYYPYFNDFLLNRDYVLVPFKSLSHISWSLYKWLSPSTEPVIFIRPDSGLKKFTGTTLDMQDLQSFVDEFDDDYNDLVVCSPPQKIKGEWRYVTHGQNIVASSCYMFGETITIVPHAPPSADKFVQSVLEVNWKPNDLVVLDIAMLSDDTYKLIEVNAFETSGLYACNTTDIVQYVQDNIQSLWQ